MVGIPVWMSSKPSAWYFTNSSGRFKPKGITGKASNCLMLLRSMISSVVTTRMALAICCALVAAAGVFVVFTLAVGAGVDVAELAGAGAVEPPELVWLVVVVDASTLESAGVVAGVETDVTLDVAEAVTVVVVAAAAEDTTLVGLRGLMGLTGLVTFVGLVTLFTHVLEVVVQLPDHKGEP